MYLGLVARYCVFFLLYLQRPGQLLRWRGTRVVGLWHTESPQSSHTIHFGPFISLWLQEHSRNNKTVLSMQGVKNEEENWIRVSKRDSSQKDSAS